MLNTFEEVKRMSLKNRPILVKLKETKNFKQLLVEVNQTIGDMQLEQFNLDELNQFTYASALYIQRKIAPWVKEERPRKDRRNRNPSWKEKRQKKINQIRAEISVMMANEPQTKSLQNKIRRIKRKYSIDSNQFKIKVAEHQATLKGLASDLRNKEKKIENKRINKQFRENPRAVYRNLIDETIEVENPPEKAKLE